MDFLRNIVLLGIGLGWLFLAAKSYQEVPQNSYAIIGATLIDGTGRPPIKNSALLISDNKIIAVGTEQQIKIPPNTRIINAHNKWIVPGLIDAHVHFSQSAGLFTRPDVIDLRNQRSYADEAAWIKQRINHTMSRYICSGITSVVDLGGSFWTLSLRRQFSHASAPRVSATGPLLTTYLPEELKLEDPQFIELADTQTATQAVRDILGRGADMIKIWFLKRGHTQDKLESIRAAISQAHQKNIRVAVHATQRALATLAVEAGADILVHSVSDELLDAYFIQLLKKKNIIYIPTLQVKKGYDDVLTGNYELNPIEKACGDSEVISTWAELSNPQEGDSDDDNDNIAQENLRRVAKAGVTIAAGSDAGNIGTMHGPGLHKELELMVQAGLSPFAVLLAATRDAALVFDRHPQVGTLEAGKLADLVILKQDPLIDIRNLSKIDLVIKDGKISPKFN